MAKFVIVQARDDVAFEENGRGFYRLTNLTTDKTFEVVIFDRPTDLNDLEMIFGSKLTPEGFFEVMVGVLPTGRTFDLTATPWEGEDEDLIHRHRCRVTITT